MDTLNRVKKLCDEVLLPDALTLDQHSSFPSTHWEAISKASILGMLHTHPESSWAKFSQVVIEMAKVCPSTALIYEMSEIGGWFIKEYGTSEFKNRYLERIAHGELRVVVAVSDTAGKEVTFDRRNDGFIYINGSKQHVSGADEASIFIVSVNKSPDKNIWGAVVLSDTNGLYINECDWDSLGLRGQDPRSITFQQIQCTPEMLLTLDNSINQIQHSPQSLGFASLAVGVANGLMNIIKPYIRHKSHSRSGGRLIELYGEATTKLEVAKRMLQYACDLMDKGDPDSGLASLRAIIVARESAMEISDACLQIGGARLYKDEQLFHLLYRDLRGLLLLGPADFYTKWTIGKSSLET